MRKSIFLILFVLLIAGCSSQTSTFQKADFVRIVDGDTIVIDRGYGNETVRLIGIDAPESVHQDPSRNTEEGRRASAFLADWLKNTAIVYLQKDVSDTDRYDRLLRYVWLKQPESENESEVRTQMVNAILILNGFAFQHSYPPDTANDEIFQKLMQEAKENHEGLWK